MEKSIDISTYYSKVKNNIAMYKSHLLQILYSYKLFQCTNTDNFSKQEENKNLVKHDKILGKSPGKKF